MKAKLETRDMANSSDTVSVSQGVSKGNTDGVRHPPSRNRSRSWCFTLNNYTEEDVVSLSHNKWDDMKINKLVFQEEIGKNKTKHLQGVVKFRNQVSFSNLKEFHKGIHWSKCRNIKASIKYCSKVDTRNGELYTIGDVENGLYKEYEKVPEAMTSKEINQKMKVMMQSKDNLQEIVDELKNVSMI